MTIRKLTREQFADGLVLDSERLESAVNDAFEELNNIGPDVDVSSMLQKQIVWGEVPPRWDQESALGFYKRMNYSPWLPVPPPSLTTINERLKSNDPRGISPVTPTYGNAGEGYAWQVSFWTDDPIIITDIDLAMHMNEGGDLTNYPYYIAQANMIWQSAAATPSPLSTGDFLEDVVVSVVVDSPYNQQVASEVNIALHKNFFSLDNQRFNRASGWETADMLPSPTKNTFTRGWWYQAKEVNAPVPAKSRVRVNIFVPNWNKVQDAHPASTVNGWTYGDSADYNRTAFSRFMWSGTLTFLERKA